MTDASLERVLATLLRTGVFISAAVVAAGGIWLLASSGRSQPAYRQFRGEPAELRSASGLVGSLAHPRPETVIQFGLLLLVATPVARVIFSLVVFAIGRDGMYVAITLMVLVVLAFSLMTPYGGG
jgi:uncharacterized membrane protein